MEKTKVEKSVGKSNGEKSVGKSIGDKSATKIAEKGKTGTEKIPGVESSSSTRKKKSKGRNGNIYIGVFNRIEWMKLQDAFGFTTVKNFGTFVLETMSRVHGDIQFWCDFVTDNDVYPGLAKYEWRNGLPQALNYEGQTFTPELDLNMSEERQIAIYESGKNLWEQRLMQIQMQQQLKLGEGLEGVGTFPVAHDEFGMEENEKEAEFDMEENEKEAEFDVEDMDTTGLLENYLECMEDGEGIEGNDGMLELESEAAALLG